MNTLPVSIFNDVIGPVMRGPSSSHTAAAVRIASMAKMLLGGEPSKAVFRFSRKGSLATTHESQGSDLGLAAGLCGISVESPDMLRSLEIARGKGMKIDFIITDLPVSHPNTYELELTGSAGEKLNMTALSTGGGMAVVTEIDSFRVEMFGDLWEAVYYVAEREADARRAVTDCLASLPEGERPVKISYSVDDDTTMAVLGFNPPPGRELLDGIAASLGAYAYRFTEPVLPVLTAREGRVLFSTARELENVFDPSREQLWQAGLKYEALRGGTDEKWVWDYAASLIDTMRGSVRAGLAGTSYDDRILGHQCGLLGNRGRIPDMPLINMTSRYVTAVMEAKSAFETIVAAPTAGSCGVLPGVILGYADVMGLGGEDCIKALLTAGTIGVFIASGSTFSAEVGGCQAECGAASGMAAAAVVQLAGGSAAEALDAASFALQNVMGMVCDPVAGRVEVPCLGKNILAATNAITTANLILAGMDAVIPLDETIAAMDSVGRALPFELRCTGLGGLSLTPTSKKIEENLKKKK